MRTRHYRAADATIGAFLAVLTITAAVLSGCGSGDTPPDTGIPTDTTTETAPPPDPFDSATFIRQWQKDTVSQIISVGKGRKDVDDTAITAALIAAHAEGQWLTNLSDPGSRNLFGWTAAANHSWSPDSPPEVVRAINQLYDRTAQLEAAEPAPDNPTDLALAAQIGESSKYLTYFADRPCVGDQSVKLCTPDKTRAAYQESATPAVAAFQMMSH